ncbi:MAG: hypothetical protein P1P74_11620 [Desulfuromonadales bacterium]|nr:hypothetical protein [Desulfuromonadales bacterium]
MNSVKFCIYAALMAFLLLHGATTGTDASGWSVYDMPTGERNRNQFFTGYPRSAEGLARDGMWQSIHVAHVIPGQSYRLGLRLRSDHAQKISVSLFDRWPYAEGARPILLSTGGALRDQQGEQEFQWWVSIDKESVGSLLYVKVGIEPGLDPYFSDLKYQIFIVDSPRSPVNSVGRGVIYHRGPTDLKLQENIPSAAFVYQLPSSRVSDGRVDNTAYQRERWRPENNLIKNGDFLHGLANWQLRPAKGEGIGVFDGKLRIWSRDAAKTSGVVQQLDIDVSTNDTLELKINLMIESQTESFQAEGSSPLTLSICYEDSQTGVHCGKSAFVKNFVVGFDETRPSFPDVVAVQPKRWLRYSFDLKELKPEPRRLISVELSGSGAPEREVWVQNVKISQ